MNEKKCKNPKCKNPVKLFDKKARLYCSTNCQIEYLKYENKDKNKDIKIDIYELVEYYKPYISDYNEKNTKTKLKSILMHVKQDIKYIELCDKKIQECGGKISLTVLDSFVAGRCKAVNFSNLDFTKF